jgi:MYXO-CTERM domain-containing protein
MAIGTCSGATTTVDAAPPPKDSGVDAHVAHDAGVDSGDHVVTDSPGCGCRVAPPSGTSETRLLLGAALLGLVARRRRRSGRRSAARRVR